MRFSCGFPPRGRHQPKCTKLRDSQRGLPRLTIRVIVTAAIDEHLWAEWRHWVGRALAEVTERGLHLPDGLRKKGDAALAEISKRVDDAGFQIREGLIAHDTVTIDSFRL